MKYRHWVARTSTKNMDVDFLTIVRRANQCLDHQHALNKGSDVYMMKVISNSSLQAPLLLEPLFKPIKEMGTPCSNGPGNYYGCNCISFWNVLVAWFNPVAKIGCNFYGHCSVCFHTLNWQINENWSSIKTVWLILLYQIMFIPLLGV